MESGVGKYCGCIDTKEWMSIGSTEKLFHPTRFPKLSSNILGTGHGTKTTFILTYLDKFYLKTKDSFGSMLDNEECVFKINTYYILYIFSNNYKDNFTRCPHFPLFVTIICHPLLWRLQTNSDMTRSCHLG